MLFLDILSDQLHFYWPLVYVGPGYEEVVWTLPFHCAHPPSQSLRLLLHSSSVITLRLLLFELFL